VLKTRSKFYYGHEVTELNKWIDFQEGANVYSAEMRNGNYSLQEFVLEVSRSMSDVGQDYSVTVNRATRIVTISAASNFSLLTATGVHAGNDAFDLLGFESPDKTGSNTYTGTAASGFEYIPQFFLQDYTPTEHLQEAIGAVLNETGSGVVEVIKFGTKKFMECQIQFINDYQTSNDSWIEQDLSGVSNAISFLKDIVKKSHIEFMPDRDSPSTFQTLLLESTESSSTGTGYRFIEDVATGLTGYYRTGKLVFRLVE
jgi:hypothetical protein